MSAPIDRLLANARAGQWSLVSGVDWTLSVRPPNRLSRKFYTTVISHLRAGERATAEMCGELRRHVTEPVARELLDLQIADELRHATVYEAYLNRIGEEASVTSAVAEALDCRRSWQGSWLGPIVAYHIVIEGEALHLQRELCDNLDCPLFSNIAGLVVRDEARHVAFGKIYLERKLSALPRDERIDIFQWVHATWWTCAHAALGSWALGRRLAGVDLDSRWARQVRAMIDIGLIGPHEASDFRRAERRRWRIGWP